jgi:hypothetical protein
VTAPDRRLLVGLLAVLVLVFALVASNVAANHAPKPHGVPVGLIGDTPAVVAVAGSLAHSAPGAYNVHRYATLAEARAAILDRSVYGAYSPAPSSRLLVANAASLSVASLLKQRFAGAGRVNGRSPVVQDVAPLPSSDPNGATAFSMLLSLILAGELGAVLIFTLGRHRSAVSRLLVVAGMGLGAGFAAALVTNVVVGAFQGQFLAVWGVSAVFVLSIAVPVAAFQSLVGVGGTAIGAILFLVIGNPASGGSSAPELLPAFWRQLSQLLPPGAAITATRDVVYFHGQGIGRALLVLSLWIVAGTAVVVTLYVLRARTSPVPAPAQPVPA